MKSRLIMGILAIFASLFSCNAQQAKYQSVSVKEFETVTADTTVVRLDVRTPAEFAEGHLEGALNIDVNSESFISDAEKNLPKDKTIAVYCRSGRRSKRACDILVDNGFKVIELDKGYIGWTEAGKKVVK